MAAALRAAANFGRRGCRVFARGFAKLRVNFQQSVAIIVPSTVMLVLTVQQPFVTVLLQDRAKWIVTSRQLLELKLRIIL